ASGAVPQVALPAADDPSLTTLLVSASGETAGLSVEVLAGEADEANAYTLVVRRDGTELARYASADITRGTRGALAVPDAAAAPITLTEVTRDRRPAPGVHALAVPSAERLTLADFTGDSDARTGLAGLEAIDEITMLVAPDVMTGAEDL